MQISSEHITDGILMNGYRLVRMTDHRRKDMRTLHEAVYGVRVRPGHYPKKYDTGYTGKTNIGFIAYKGDEAVAYYGVIPCFVRYGGKLVLAAQSADIMTHPRHRRRGLFVALANLTYALCRAEGIKLLFGFPNQQALPILVSRLGWRITGHMECFVIPVNTIPLERLTIRLAALKKVYDAYANRVLRACLLPRQGISHTQEGTHRDNAYLRYKAYSHTMVIGIGGARVWFRIRDGLIVGDMDCPEGHVRYAIRELKKLASQLGLPYIRFQANQHARLHGLLRTYIAPFPTFPTTLKKIAPDEELGDAEMAFTYADIDIF